MANPNNTNTTPSSTNTTVAETVTLSNNENVAAAPLGTAINDHHVQGLIEAPVVITAERLYAAVTDCGESTEYSILYCPTTGKEMKLVAGQPQSGTLTTAQTGTGAPESSQGKRNMDELPRCHVCNRQFISSRSLQSHMQVHKDRSRRRVRAPPTFKGHRKAVQRVEVPNNTTIPEIIDLTLVRDVGSPPEECRIQIDLNKPPPRDDEDDGMGGRPGLVA